MRSLRLLPLVSLAALCTGVAARAQCYEAAVGASIGTGDDAVLAMQPLGFAFPFGGATYTDVHVSTNGFVYLSNAGTPAAGGALCCSGTTASLVAGSPKIAPYWSDLNVMSGTGNVMFNALPGKAVVTWQNAVEFGDTNQFSVQLQLLSTGEIFFAYDGRCAIRTGGDFLVGMSEGGGVAVPAASDFSAIAVSTTTTNFEIFNNVGLNYDLAGQTVQFLPTGLGYTWIPQQCASAQVPYGAGCYTVPSGFYELFPTNAIDLANSSMTMLRTGSSYLMLSGLTTFVPPSGSATSLALTDDSQTTVTLSAPFSYVGGSTTTLSVCSNGYISVDATGNGTGFTPTVATMLTAPYAGFWSWHDFNPGAAGSGQVKFEEVAGVAYITWDGVYSYGTTNPETFQFQVELATGNVNFVWTTIGGFGTTGYLVGYSGGGASAGDPGSTDISAALPSTFSCTGLDQLPLVLTATTPVAGAVMTLTTDAIPEYAPGSGIYIAMNIIGLTQYPAPGIDLGILGAPGCAALVSLDYAQSMVGASASQQVTFPLPSLVGLQFYSQSAALVVPNSLPNGQNAFGLTTSNAIAASIGIW